MLGGSTSALKSLNPTESNLRVPLEIDKKSPVQRPWTKSAQLEDTRKFFVRDSNPMPEISRFLPKRALRAVLEWADIHRDDLLADWHLARLEQPLNSIEPLE
jgi:hypothetical protein